MLSGVCKCLARLLAVLFLAAAPAAAAQGASSLAPGCHAYSATSLDLAAADGLQWICRDGDWKDGQPVTWLRFPAQGLGTPATEFSSRITRFGRIDIAAVADDGTMAVRSYLPAQARTVVNGAAFALDLPPARSDTAYWIVRIEKPHSVTIATEATISRTGQRAQDGLVAITILTFVLGMLVVPLLFDVNFYTVLRERFVLIHAGIVVAMIFYLLFAGGLAALVWNVPLTLMAILAPLSWAVGVGLAGFLIRAFLETDEIPHSWLRAASYCGWWAILVPGVASLQLEATQAFDNTLYFFGFAPVIPTYVVIILRALMRGSRPALFLAVAWTPIIIAAVDRLLRGIGVYVGSSSLDKGMFLALGLEVVVIALGVADRFLTIRRERDRAIDSARALEESADRDPLTGLFNRRLLERQFKALRAQGFTTMAVIDLDHFKGINDTHGHAIGDRVLQAASTTLASDSDTLAFRLGGEEFMLLLRGADALQRAEYRRRALSTQVAADVGSLDRIVTASMGLVKVPRDAMPDVTFAQLYEWADGLLYEAKQAGRNRTMSERVRAFHDGAPTAIHAA